MRLDGGLMRAGLAGACLSVAACRPATELRVANGTGLPLTGVDVEYGFARTPATLWRIDSLGGADTTAYRRVHDASSTPRVRVTTGGRALEAAADERPRPLVAGRYTYILRLGGADQLIVVVQREPDR